MSALTVLGGTAAYASEGGRPHHEKETASLENGGDAKTEVDQSSKVEAEQLAFANTGGNLALGITGNINLGQQDCTTHLEGGELGGVEDENVAGNEGGNCTNDATQRNTGKSEALIETGNARTTNGARADVDQTNGGGSEVRNTASNNKVEADDGPASLHNGGDARLYVDQHSRVNTTQVAGANTGLNGAFAGTIGVNYGTQTGTSNVSGGNIHHADDKNKAGNVGGNADNKAIQSNNGSATASIKTGDATATNSSTTTVNQTNTGGASSTNTANGNTVSSD